MSAHTHPSDPEPRNQSRIEKWVGNPLFWLFFVLIIASYPLIHAAIHPLPEPLPVLGTVTEFELSDEKNRTFNSEILDGLLWVATVTCATCESTDEALGEKLFDIQHRSRNTGKLFRLVSFSVNPAEDTPEALMAHAKSLRYSPRMWSFLTGDSAVVHKTLRAIFGFRSLTGVKSTVPALESAHHLAAIVDGDMQVRGYYDLRDEDSFEAMLRDMGLVLNRGY